MFASTKSFIILAVIRRVCGVHLRVIAPGQMLQRWRAVGNTVSDLTGPRFEPLSSRYRDERVSARPTQTKARPVSYFSLMSARTAGYSAVSYNLNCYTFVFS